MNLYKYLPFEKYTLVSRLSAEEVRKRLIANIEPAKKFQFYIFKKTGSKPYEGRIEGNQFTINRIIDYRNSFLPVIRGQISEKQGQVYIHINMRPSTGVLIFFSFWIGIVTLVCLAIAVAAIAQFRKILENGFSPAILIPFGMFIFGSLLITMGFKSESRDSKEFLRKLLEGQEENHQY
jgi:hypothetical protein